MDDAGRDGDQVTEARHTAAPEGDAKARRRRRDGKPGVARSVIGGLASLIAMLAVLFIPVIVMLRLPPTGFPTQLPDGLGLLLFVLAGVVIGLLLQFLRTRPIAAGIVTVLVLLLAVWFQRGTWWLAGGVPAPPVLPLMGTALVPVAGMLLGTLLVLTLGGRGGPAPRDHAEASAPTPLVQSIVAGAVAAAAVLAVTEGAVWGRQVLQTTFEGPGGLSRAAWLGLLFVATLVAGVLVGWVATSEVRRPVAPAVTAVLVLLTAMVVWALGGLDGPPRILLYGLAIGVTAVGAVGPYRPRRRAEKPATSG